MPYARPTLTQLRQQAMQDITSSDLPGVDGFLRFAVLRVMAWVQAGFAWLLYDFLDWIAKQAVPWTATDEYLAAWLALIGVEQEDATFASGPVTFTGSSGTIDTGTILNTLDGSQSYSVTAPATISGGTVNVSVEAATAGAAGNLEVGTTLVLANPIPGINSNGVVASGGIVGGADQETQDAFRLRGLAQYAARPQGGDAGDYIEWALAVPGITRAWVNPNGFGPGTVVVYPMLDITESAFDGFPQGTGGVATNETRDAAATGDLLTLANAIFPLRPVTALVYAEAPVNQPVAFTITNLGSNNTTAMQNAITAALEDMFLRIGFVGGTINPATMAAWPSIDPNDMYAAVAAIPGLTKFDITIPSGPITPDSGKLFTVGSISFST